MSILGGILGGGDGGASANRAQENRRQALARDWSDYVTAAFEGGQVPLYTSQGGLMPQANQNYLYLNNSGTWQPYKAPKGRGLSPNVYTMSMQNMPGYNQGFYDSIKGSYLNYAMPQYQTQLGQTQQSLLGNLSNQGLLNSSAARQQADALSQQATTAKQSIADQGQAYADQVKQQMGQQEANLKAYVLASSDPASAAAGALQTASTFATPPAFAPLGSLFQNFSNMYLANQMLQQPQGYYMPQGYNPTAGQSSAWMPSNTR